MQALPDACNLPVPEPAPAGTTAAASHLWGEHGPRDAALEHEQDARQRGTVGHTRPAAQGSVRGRRQQGRDRRPEFIRNERFCHAAILAQALVIGFETGSYSLSQKS